MDNADQRGQKSLAIYHVMRADEDFDDTADILFQLVKKAATDHPGGKRALFLDIEGHRNKAGGFDADAAELQQHFVTGFLSRWLSEISMPLLRCTTREQHEDLPESLVTIPGADPKDRDADLRGQAQALNARVFDSETAEFVHPDGSRQRHD